jgi:hypothetical protein
MGVDGSEDTTKKESGMAFKYPSHDHQTTNANPIHDHCASSYHHDYK